MQDALKKLNLRELRLLLLGASAVVCAALVVVMLVPKAKALQAANTAVAVLEAASADGAELERQLQERYASIEALKYQLHGDMANLPVRQVESYIIGRLQRVSWNNDVDLVSVQPATGDRVQIFQEMLFRVQLTGRYRDLYRWLWETRRDLGFVVVKELGLKRRDNDDSEPLLMADLSLASYRAVE